MSSLLLLFGGLTGFCGLRAFRPWGLFRPDFREGLERGLEGGGCRALGFASLRV